MPKVEILSGRILAGTIFPRDGWNENLVSAGFLFALNISVLNDTNQAHVSGCFSCQFGQLSILILRLLPVWHDCYGRSLCLHSVWSRIDFEIAEFAIRPSFLRLHSFLPLFSATKMCDFGDCWIIHIARASSLAAFYSQIIGQQTSYRTFSLLWRQKSQTTAPGYLWSSRAIMAEHHTCSSSPS